jgi:hypothetical protein
VVERAMEEEWPEQASTNEAAKAAGANTKGGRA